MPGIGPRRVPRGRRQGRSILARVRGLATATMLAAFATLAAQWLACASGPPRDADDICSIFRENRSWHRSASRAAERWGVPESVQLAIIHQESSFRAQARPPRQRILWLLPGPRRSSAYGYGQVVDDTWHRYVRTTGRRRATRDDFGDVTDFIGWYGSEIHRRTGVSKADAERLYIAYHEGPGGFTRGSHRRKPWLERVAQRVGRRARTYEGQYEVCEESLSRGRFLGIF